MKDANSIKTVHKPCIPSHFCDNLFLVYKRWHLKSAFIKSINNKTVIRKSDFLKNTFACSWNGSTYIFNLKILLTNSWEVVLFLLEDIVQCHPEHARGVPVQHQVLFGLRADVGPLSRVITPVPIPGETPPRIAQSQQPANKTVREISYYRNTRHYFYLSNFTQTWLPFDQCQRFTDLFPSMSLTSSME